VAAWATSAFAIATPIATVIATTTLNQPPPTRLATV